MNKIFTLAALLLWGGGLSAQRLPQAPIHSFDALRPASLSPAQPTHESSEGGARGGEVTVVFSEDFANGLAGNNGGLGAWTVQGPNGNIWRYTHTGPVGAYSEPTDIIGSPTAANGFMIFNSDSANTLWPDGTIVDDPVNFVGSLVSPVIDLTATPYVQVRFSQRMRYCCNEEPTSHFVQVSTDGGTTWGVALPTDDGIAVNDDSGTQVRTVNITAGVMVDPSNVQFRFTQDGEEASVSHYHWQIDDVEITTLPLAQDLVLSNPSNTLWDLNAAATYDSLPYTIFPISELRPRAINASYFNNGSEVASNATLQFTGSDGYEETVDLGNLAQGAMGTVYTDSYTPTAEIGTHTIDMMLSGDDADEMLANNSGSTSLEVSDFIYARDNNARDGDITSSEVGGAFYVGNWFHTNVDELLYGIDVAFASGSAVNMELNAWVLNDAREALAESDYRVLVSNNLNTTNGHKFVTFIFEQPIQLDAGGDYFACVKHFGGETVKVATSGTSPAQTSLICESDELEVQTPSQWFYTTSTPMVRMNFNPSVGISENDIHNGIGLGQNIPNPAKDMSYVNFSLENSAAVTMELHDVSGKLVRTLVQGTMAPGTHRVDINTGDLQDGVYFYTLTTDKAIATKRMTIVH